MGTLSEDAARQFSFCRSHQNTHFLKEKKVLCLEQTRPFKEKFYFGRSGEVKSVSIVKLAKKMEVQVYCKPFGRVKNKLKVYTCRCTSKFFFHVTTGDNFSDFLLASLGNASLPKGINS